ncbi:hypothetical protein G6O67_008909 [Ophiocordyceps sinensis]|uniref:Beige protein homolog 1 n=1 Tax=Ophiocordyceps sinensis TaxID=72228 RepID=A0A8H4LPC6_9HYPO|nr:hypothetical protein G6O67_008909 [Ophiocordyceps sinensis]
MRNLWRLAGFTPLALKLVERAVDGGGDGSCHRDCVSLHPQELAQQRGHGEGQWVRHTGHDSSIQNRTRKPLSRGYTVSRLVMSNEERDSLTFQVLSLILGFVGYNHVDPIESFIVNPLAYRILLIDLDIWRRSAPRTQELFYGQFVTFAVNSKHHDFNGRRLIRMRIVKRLLEAMKGEGISDDVLDHFMDALRLLSSQTLAKRVLRSMSLFITYAFHTPAPSASRTARPLSGISASSTPGLAREDPGTKWLLYLLADDDATIVIDGCKILSRLLVVQGPSYAVKFSGQSGGFTIMASRLKRFWDIPTLWSICFSILFGYDVADIDFNRDFDVDGLFGITASRRLCGIKKTPTRVRKPDPPAAATSAALKPDIDHRAMSMDLDQALESRLTIPKRHERGASRVGVLETSIRFLQELQARSSEFRDLALGSDWVREHRCAERRRLSFWTAQTASRHEPRPVPPLQVKPQQSHGGALSEEMLDLLLGVFVDQVFARKDFVGFGLFSKVPPGFQEHQAYLESYILKRVIARVSGKIQANESVICEPRILTNMSRLCLHISEAIFEGWFIDGARTAEVSKLKSVRLCSQAVSMIRSCFLRIILLKLSDLDSSRVAEQEAKEFMNKLAYWQMPILECFSLEDDYLKLFWYQLYTKLVDDKPCIRIAAANFLRIVLVQKPDESITTISSCMASDQRKLSREFQKLTEVDDETFVVWVDQHRPSLDRLFLGSMQRPRWSGICGDRAPSFNEPAPPKWKLDRTEGRNRMRLRLLPDSAAADVRYQPKRKAGEARSRATSSGPSDCPPSLTPLPRQRRCIDSEPGACVDLVDDPNDPNEGDENFEDNNRKVMRRLEHGDPHALYIMDNVFQCASGDIVNVWEAPADERDPFTMVDFISVSKRRFLFRDVAIEVFFTDGRSYLLTTINAAVRDQLFAKMLSKASHTSAPNALPDQEDAWRLEALKTFEDSPQGFGAGLGTRLGTFFNTTPWNPIMKRWQRGEMSNFHYLMMVNTMAGRTFNDLTQYPVFPWVLADYTSQDLDLEDPATFRDLSKPMGAQTQGRVAGFVETYDALQEIGQTPFHYGTHYSSAMIVSSYLIRLPPFVQSYLLVQGDSFDHADRIFQSVGDAWTSASCRNKTDVRELIPEFFCLPEFLTNINGYDFGHRQSNGAKVDNVALPPWAKGDPKIFIAKHREALESPYVSEHVHHWIDLVFGHKQRGEAAVESVNVFHHLSYAGASDLDRITDANERAITAGVIHNFGQTPHQVFAKPHAAREHVRCPVKRLDTGVLSLICLDHPLLESHDRVASLVYSSKLDRLLCAPPLRLIFPPYDKFLDWGFADSSIRFCFSDNRKPAGLFENLHTGQLSCACFADSKTLMTAGEDCVVSVYTVRTAPGKQVDLVPRSSVFGHKTPVTAIAVSKSFSTFVTASSDGQAFLWDLNQLSFIRKLPLVRQVECARINDVSGEVMLCSGPNVLLYTLNGTLILDQNVCAEPDDYVHSCAFYEGAANEWLENHLVFTGHSKGRVNVWRKSVSAGKWTLELLRRLDHADCKSDKGENTEAGITCIAPMPTCLYTGDDDGRVYEWNFGRGDR